MAGEIPEVAALYAQHNANTYAQGAQSLTEKAAAYKQAESALNPRNGPLDGPGGGISS